MWVWLMMLCTSSFEEYRDEHSCDSVINTIHDTSEFMVYDSFGLHESIFGLGQVEHPLAASGGCAIEVFSGTEVVTLGLQLARVPTCSPWDILLDGRMNVVTNGRVLLELVAAKVITTAWVASPCSSLTCARLPALRSASFPEGLRSLGARQTRLVDEGNMLSWFSITLCLMLYMMNGYFALENPSGSFIWLLKMMLKLYRLSGVAFCNLWFQPYGALYVKPTSVLHNVPTLHSLRLPRPARDAVVVLRGFVIDQNGW